MGAGIGDGIVLSTFGGGEIQAALWIAGAAPGNTTVAGVGTFPADRLLFNLDNDGSSGTNDLEAISAEGLDALRNSIAFVSPLVVPEPTSLFLSIMGLGLLARRRR